MTWIDNTFQFENQTRQSWNTISESNEARAKDYNIRLHFKLTQQLAWSRSPESSKGRKAEENKEHFKTMKEK